MLEAEVIAAVEQGTFHLYAVATLDEAMTLLTGLPAGIADATGNFPAGSVNARAGARLGELAQRRQAFTRPALTGAAPGG